MLVSWPNGVHLAFSSFPLAFFSSLSLSVVPFVAPLHSPGPPPPESLADLAREPELRDLRATRLSCLTRKGGINEELIADPNDK